MVIILQGDELKKIMGEVKGIAEAYNLKTYLTNQSLRKRPGMRNYIPYCMHHVSAHAVDHSYSFL